MNTMGFLVSFGAPLLAVLILFAQAVRFPPAWLKSVVNKSTEVPVVPTDKTVLTTDLASVPTSAQSDTDSASQEDANGTANASDSSSQSFVDDKKIPVEVEDYKLPARQWLFERWTKIQATSAIVGGVAGFVFGMTLGRSMAHGELLIQGFSATAVAVMVYLLISSTFTDFKVRLVSRWTLRLASLILLVPSFMIVAKYQPSFLIAAFVMLLVMSLGVTLVGKGIGSSDGRAFTLALLGVWPLAGIEGVQTSLFALIGLSLTYFIYAKLNSKTKTMKLRVSTPMVPIILVAFLIGLTMAALGGVNPVNAFGFLNTGL